MTRSVKVELEASVGKYIPPVEEAKAKTDGLDNKVKDLDRDLKKAELQAAKTATTMRLMGGEADGLRNKLNDIGPGATNSLQQIDRQIEKTKADLRQFVADFNRTGSADSFNLWQQAAKDLTGLDRIRKQLAEALKGAVQDASSDDKTRTGFWGKLFDWTGIPGLIGKFQGLGLQAGDAFGKGFKGFFDAMPGELKVILIGIIGAVVVGSLSAIGATLNGLLLSTTGLGGIGLILAGQFQSPIVRSAVSQLGHDLMNALGSATAPFAGRLGSGIGVIETGLQKLLASIAPSLQGLSNAINPVAQGFAKMFAALGPGLAKAFDAAGPVLMVLAKELPNIGKALGAMFSDIASSSRGGAEGLRFFLTGVEVLIRAVGIAIKFLSGMFQFFVAFADDMGGLMEKAFGWIPLLGDWIKTNHDMFHNIRGSADQAGLGVDNLTSSFGGLAPELQQSATLAQQAATAFQNLSKGLDAAFNRTMGVDQATLQLATSMTGLADSVQKNGTSLKENTKEGQANLGVIQQAIGNINSLRDANIANGDSIDTANGKYQDQLNQLQKTLIGLGYNKDAVKAMIDQYRVIPSSVSTVVNVLGLDAATTKLDSVTQKFNDLNGKVVTTYLVTDTTTGQQSRHTTSRGYQRWGGIYEHAEEGLLSAGIYPAMSPARYAFAEPATGGEAFVPKFGDYGRSTAIVDQAARWYGGRFAPGGGASPAPVVNVIVSPKDGALGALVDLIDVRVEQGNHATAAAVAGGPRL